MASIQAKQQAEAITQIANVSRLLREAIAATIPVAPEQYLTVAIPGTTIDVRDIKEGGTFVYGAEYAAFPPMAVRQAEGALVDNMIPLAKVMIGNTGKSVARSYSRALDGLVPRKATVKSGGVNPIRSPGEAGYDAAMKYLTTRSLDTGLTPVDVYVQKQASWAEAQDEWDQAKIAAQRSAMARYPDDIVRQREDYDEWNQANYRKFKFSVQGRWMDWVSNGNKYDVEFNFGMVDTDSIMARIENSKESMRNSTMVDADGANEILGVSMTPKNWATLCKQKQEGWFKRNGSYTLEQLEQEIKRLVQLDTSYEVLEAMTQASPPEYPLPGTTAPTTAPGFKDKVKALYTADGDLNRLKEQAKRKATKAEKDAITSSQEYKDAEAAVKQGQQDVADSVEADTKANSEQNRANLAGLSGTGKDASRAYLSRQRAIVGDQIKKLKAEREDKLINQASRLKIIVADSTPKPSGEVTTVATESSALANPVFNVDPPPSTETSQDSSTPAAGSESDPWVTISASFSAEEQKSSSSTSTWGFSAGGGAGYGLFSVGGNYSHDQTTSKFQSEMASCDVSITFEALVVNIRRPWLYGELFSDFELDVADNIKLSPGAEVLHRLLTEQAVPEAAHRDSTDVAKGNHSVISELAQYNSFPAYPTSFIVGANTVIDFQGATQSIEDYFSAQANSGSVSVGYGPFSVNSSFKQSSSQQLHQVQSTATGCRLTFGAPQIIGWVCQILPTLPRDTGFEPMVQNVDQSRLAVAPA